MCPGFETPALLTAFARWARTRPWGSVGRFDLQGQRFPDGYVEGGADLAPQLGFFMHLPDGSLTGFWRPAGGERDPAIVVVGSEGQLQVVASSLATFLWRLALARFARNGSPAEDLLPQDDEDDEDDDEPIPDLRRELAAWLTAESVPRPPRAVLDAQDDERSSAFETWLEAHGRAERERLARLSAARELASLLRRELPANAEAWTQSGVEVVFACDRAAARWWPPFGANGKPRAPLEPAQRDHVLALVRALRDDDARRHPERGPFLSVLVTASPKHFAVRREYLARPDAWHGIPDDLLVREIVQHPRSPYWTPDWVRPR